MGSHIGIGAPPILVYFSGDWDVHWGYGVLTHGHMYCNEFKVQLNAQRTTGVDEANCVVLRKVTRIRQCCLMPDLHSFLPRWFSMGTQDVPFSSFFQ